MKSIRTYLVVIIVSVICLSNFVAALQGYRDSLESADKLVDEQILERFDSLSVLIAKNIEVPQTYAPNSINPGKYIGIELIYVLGNSVGRQRLADQMLYLRKTRVISIGRR